jgi:hypothetical protein
MEVKDWDIGNTYPLDPQSKWCGHELAEVLRVEENAGKIISEDGYTKTGEGPADCPLGCMGNYVKSQAGINRGCQIDNDDVERSSHENSPFNFLPWEISVCRSGEGFLPRAIRLMKGSSW